MNFIVIERCPICNSSKYTLFFNNPGLPQSLLICKDCRHIFWDAMPTSEYLNDYYTKQYTEAHNQNEEQESIREYYRNHVDEILSWVKTTDRITLVDYGCSFPVLLTEAKNKVNAIGVDYDKSSLEYGINNGLTMYTPDEFFREINDNSVDIIRFSHVLEHAVNPVEILLKCIVKLKPKGIVYITQPNMPTFKYAESVETVRDAVFPEHLQFFCALSLVTMFKKCNLNIIKLFTHTDADEIFNKFRNDFDIEIVEEKLSKIKGDLNFGLAENRPYYAGKNSFILGQKSSENISIFNFFKK